MGQPSVSVVIVAFRQREALAQALDSCQAAGEHVPGGCELIAVDNGGLAWFIRERWPDVHVIEPGENVGFAGGAQRGIEASSGEWVALVNDDARIADDALAQLLAAGSAAEKVGSVASLVRFQSDPELVNSAGIDVDSLGNATERLAGRPIIEAERPGEVFGPCGCFALYRRSMLEAVGGLDERFFAYLEDVDLAWRARAAGWTSVYQPLARADHRGSASTGEGSRQKYYLVGRNRVRLLAGNMTARQLAVALPGILLYDSAYVLYVALTDRTLAPLRGRINGLREWRAWRRETGARRAQVRLGSARQGWLAALRQHRAYRSRGAPAGPGTGEG